MIDNQMKRKMVCAITVLSALLILTSTLPSRVTAADYSAVGVSEGTVANYQFKHPGMAIWEEIAWMQLFIVDTKSTIINYTLTYYFGNGTLYTDYTGAENISKVSAPSILWKFLIAANLNVGDNITIGNSRKVNQTFTATFAGASRTINNVSYVGGYKQYDRATGLSVKSMTSLGGGNWENVTLISTTAWAASAPAQSIFTTTTILVIAGVGIVALAIGYVVGKSGKRKK